MNKFLSFSVKACAVALGVVVLELLGLVGIHDIRLVQNDPFVNGVQITRIEDHQIEFADGRVLKISGPVEPEIQSAIRASGDRVGLDVDDQGYAIMFVRRKLTNCQLGRPAIVIPLIMHERATYGKAFGACGEMEKSALDRP